jgi:hypothetical protein
MTSNFRELGLADRESQIMGMLVHCVPLMSLSQLANTFYSGDRSNAVRSLRLLTDSRLLLSFDVIARTPPPASRSPIASWAPGITPPSAFRIAYRLNQRWLCQGSRKRLVFLAGPTVTALLGIAVPGKPRRALQASHELGLAEQFLHFYRERDSRWEYWIGEQSYAQLNNSSVAGLLADGTQRPDALVLRESGQVDHALEYGGLYNAKRIERFHRWCQRRSLAYEIW